MSQNQSRPSRAALASWVELLNSQAGGGHYYEDVDGILKRKLREHNNVKILDSDSTQEP
jgi:hypothetical protein